MVRAGPVSCSTEALRETIRPWDSITIPALSCPTGYLENQDYSPGRIVPNGPVAAQLSARSRTAGSAVPRRGTALPTPYLPPSFNVTCGAL